MTTPHPTAQPPSTAGSPAANGGSPPAAATPSNVRSGAGRLPGERGTIQRVGGFIARHPGGIAKAIGLALVATLVLQNLEPTSVDVLFWQVAEVPKLVLILGSMVVGGLAWELIRRSLRSR